MQHNVSETSAEKDPKQNDCLIRAEHLFYSYDDGKSCSLNDVSLEIHSGRKIAFLGANGAGKSTFFLCLNGILKPTKGQLFFHGVPYSYKQKDLLKLRQKVGIVFQNPDDQLFSASVCQEISFGLFNLGLTAAEVQTLVNQIIDYMGLRSCCHKPVHILSGGQKKQVSIADILVMKPELIILDEPVSSLDPKHTDLVNDLIDQMTLDGMTVLQSTHDVDYALRWADEVILFHEGCILAHTDPVTLFCNEALLTKANLKQPDCLKLFFSLCRKKILSDTLPVPRTLQTLEHYLEQTIERNETE